jgi:glycosyltransferase involved in cell wall biosynthesis
MNVLHCITGLSGDGAQRMLLRLVGGLQSHGINSHVVNLGCEAPIEIQFRRQGIPVSSLGLRASLTDAIRGGCKIASLIDEIRPDVVQAWMYHANAVTLLALFRSHHKPPVAWNIRRGLDDFSERSLKTRTVVRGNALMSRLPDRIIYCSRESRTQHEAFGFHKSSSCVLENGFDTHRFIPSDVSRSAFRNRYDIREDEIVIGNVGRFDLAKGHSYLLKAFGAVVKQKPEAKLVLIGRGVDPSNEQITATVRQLGLAERVLLLGEQESLEQVYPGFDVYCSASINEGFPNAISEAMTCGVPCVVTDTGASRQLVEGVGHVVPARSAEKLAAALSCISNLSMEERRALGGQARERISRLYSLDSVVNQYRDLYGELAASTMETCSHL